MDPTAIVGTWGHGFEEEYHQKYLAVLSIVA